MLRFLVLFQQLTLSSRWQDKTAIWNIGPDKGTMNIPVNGGDVKTKQWKDGLPQELHFEMRVPDSVFNDWNALPHAIQAEKKWSYRYHAFLGKGQTICATSNPTFTTLSALCASSPNEIELLGPNPPSFVGHGLRQSFGAHVQDIIDEKAKEVDYEYQQACVFVTCSSYTNRGYISRVMTGKHYCPIEFTVSWRSSVLKTNAAAIIPAGQVLGHVRMWTNVFYVALVVDSILLLCVCIASIRACSVLSEDEMY